MKDVKRPWFVNKQNVDRMILAGELEPQLNIVCRTCGAWGRYKVWNVLAYVYGLCKVCPQCGGCNTERVGK